MVDGVVLPDEPVLLMNGTVFTFAEDYGMPFAQMQALHRSGNLWLTEFEALNVAGEPSTYGGSLIALTHGEAVEEAKRRGLGERVIGRAHEVVPA